MSSSLRTFAPSFPQVIDLCLCENRPVVLLALWCVIVCWFPPERFDCVSGVFFWRTPFKVAGMIIDSLPVLVIDARSTVGWWIKEGERDKSMHESADSRVLTLE